MNWLFSKKLAKNVSYRLYKKAMGLEMTMDNFSESTDVRNGQFFKKHERM